MKRDILGKPLIPWLWPISRYGQGSGAICLGYEVYGDDCPWLVKRFFHEVVCNYIDARYWLLYRLHPRYRYHVLKIGMPGYTDYDHRLLHACMEVLRLYLEEELCGTLEEWVNEVKKTGDRSLKPKKSRHVFGRFKRSTLSIYLWWVIDKPADEKKRDELLTYCFGSNHVKNRDDDLELFELRYKEFRALEAKIDRDEQAMLHRLVSIRRTMWV